MDMIFGEMGIDEIMNNCNGCKHTEKHSGQEPCNSCGPTENFCYYQPIESEKSCETCKHTELNGCDYPCHCCAVVYPNTGFSDMWEPAEPNEPNTRSAKADTGKPRLALVPPRLIKAVGVIRTYGTAKYGDPDNWKTVEPYRYKDALIRHLVEYLEDENGVDAESGLPHLWHAACNIAFLIEMEEVQR